MIAHNTNTNPPTKSSMPITLMACVCLVLLALGGFLVYRSSVMDAARRPAIQQQEVPSGIDNRGTAGPANKVSQEKEVTSDKVPQKPVSSEELPAPKR